MEDSTFRCVRCSLPYRIFLNAGINLLQAEVILPEELSTRAALMPQTGVTSEQLAAWSKDIRAAERARLRPLLERCLDFLGDRKGCGKLLADLRRELRGEASTTEAASRTPG